jgi:hypothetical protein
VFISNMSGDWIASKLIWVVLAFAVASAGWLAAVKQAQRPEPVSSALPSLRMGSAMARGGY